LAEIEERSQEVALFKHDVEKLSAERQALETENQNMKANCEQLNDRLKGCDTEIQELIVLKDTLKEKPPPGFFPLFPVSTISPLQISHHLLFAFAQFEFHVPGQHHKTDHVLL
jgi:FtsZ-binding cell division protein ZapB